MQQPPAPREARFWPSLFALLISEGRFIEICLAHLAYKHPVGKPDPEGDRVRAVDARRAIRGSLHRSATIALSLMALALITAAAFGRLHAGSDLDWGKALQFVGGGFAGWSGVFALGMPRPTYIADSMPERLHRWLFIWLLSLGGLIALLGSIW